MATYTHGHSESVLRSHSTRTAENSAAYLLDHLTGAEHLLDVGAGPGTISADLAGRVRHVTATEIGDAELALSRTLAAERGITNMDFAVEDVHALSFADGTFDVVHTHQVLQHVPDPVAALVEMARVTRPGGIVAVRDSDYHGFRWYPEDPRLDRWMELYQLAARANGGEPDAGRVLLAWAHAAGLDGARASSSTWCYATPAEREWWGGMWADRILRSSLAEQLPGMGIARAELEEISAAWRAWAAHPDGWFSILHGEILWRKPAGPAAGRGGPEPAP